jgi:broad specificity phosphatase PhoE
VTLLLVRHADAGDRAAWTGDDTRRPLSATGRAQSEALVELFADRSIDRILSSPAKRSVDTVEPLAAARNLHVEHEDALAEGTPLDAVERLLLRHRDENVVLCSHGDVIGAVITSVRRRGVHLSDPPHWPKGSTWVIDAWPEPVLLQLLHPPAI